MTKLWGSRFQKTSDPLADKFSFSISYDHRLAPYDVQGSIAHAQMLTKCGIIAAGDGQKIVAGLKKIARDIDSGTFKYDPSFEDIHSNIQAVLKKSIGAAADRLHTARSRNDQIVLDMKLYCRDEIKEMILLLIDVQKAMVDCCIRNQDVIIPAYTHLQSAQVVLFAHHVLAYVEMLERDKSRLADAFERMNTLPLGSCALSGTSLPTDRGFVAKALGFREPSANSMDAVSDRDFILELSSAIAISGVHLSRVSEDLILWATQEFNLVAIDWTLSTGSSIMPHKKNPDMLELIRGSSAKLMANAQEEMILLKGLPLTYNRDLQLDKPPLFESVDTYKDMLGLMAKTFATLVVNKEVAQQRTMSESFFTVDVMEYLIAKGVSYREAHDTLGLMVRECLDKGQSLAELSLEELKGFSKYFNEDVKKLFNPKMSVKIKRSLGSTNPQLVDKQLRQWQQKLQ